MGNQIGIAILNDKLALVNISGTHVVGNLTYHSGTAFSDKNLQDTTEYPILIDNWQLLAVLPEGYRVLEIMHPTGIAFYQLSCKNCCDGMLIRGLQHFLSLKGIKCSCGYQMSGNLRSQL